MLCKTLLERLFKVFLHSINIPCKECREDSFFHCYGHLLLQSNFDNCTKKCLPHSLPKENMIHHEDIQLCQPSTKDHKCAKNIAFLLRLKLLARDSQSVCKLKPCFITQHKGIMTDETISDDPSYSRTVLYYNHAPRTKTNYEEFIIYDFVEMLGSFGGTLGLFVGFSFVGCISTFLKYSVILMDYIIKWSNGIGNRIVLSSNIKS